MKLLKSDWLHYVIWLVEFCFLCYNVFQNKSTMMLLWGGMLIFNILMFLKMKASQKSSPKTYQAEVPID